MIEILAPLTLSYLHMGVILAAVFDRPQLKVVLGWPVVALVATTELLAAWRARDLS